MQAVGGRSAVRGGSQEKTLLHHGRLCAGCVDPPGGSAGQTRGTEQQDADSQSPIQQQETSW